MIPECSFYVRFDCLIMSQRDKLCEIAKKIPDWKTIDLLVWPGRMSDDNAEDLAPLVKFADYGLRELSSVSEKVGFILALMELAGQNESDFIFEELCNGVIHVFPKHNVPE